MTASALLTGAILTSCNTHAEKLENAQNDVIEANKDLNKANKEYLGDMRNYKKETADKIAANDKSIAELKARVEYEKKEAKVDYKKKIAELEQGNSGMKRE